MTEAGKLSCADFNRAYLTEHTHTANILAGESVTFTFETGVAYRSSQNQWVIFYTYKDFKGKNVTLKSVDPSIQPDMKVGAWKAQKDFYTCKSGYMSCPITNLPIYR
jgi:hypothetical protein